MVPECSKKETYNQKRKKPGAHILKTKNAGEHGAHTILT